MDYQLALSVCIFLLVRLSVSHGQDINVADLLERINALENQGTLHAAALVAQETRHAQEMAEQRKLMTELQSLVAKQNQKITSLEDELKVLSVSEADEGKNDGVSPRRNVERMWKRPDALDIQRSLSGAKSHRSDKGIRSGRLVAEGPVAFEADITKGSVSHIGIGQKIVFDVVSLNLGGGYHSQHGLFIAPQPGIYIFSTSVMSYYKPHNEIWVRIMKNGQSIAGAFAYGDQSRDQGSVTVVTQLAVGDEVWVSLGGLADDSLWGSGFTSFMGCLVMFL